MQCTLNGALDGRRTANGILQGVRRVQRCHRQAAPALAVLVFV
jgi:hypothetical protein